MLATEPLEQYFTRAKIWYQNKYIWPICQRSKIASMLLIQTILLLLMLLATYNIFPLSIAKQYTITFANEDYDHQITIRRAKNDDDDLQLAVAQILLEKYVKERESYDYSKLRDQLIFVNTNSTQSVFNQYYNSLSIDNPLSPLNRLRDQGIRSINIINTNFTNPQTALIKFRAITRDGNKIIGQIVWQAEVVFNSDEIIINQPAGKRFAFLVNGYKVTLLNNEGVN